MTPSRQHKNDPKQITIVDLLRQHKNDSKTNDSDDNIKTIQKLTIVTPLGQPKTNPIINDSEALKTT